MRRSDLVSALATLAAILLAAPAAHASGADNCQMLISNPSVDYGATTRAELLKRQVSPLMMSLGRQSVTLTATCRVPTLMTLFFRGSAADAHAYRLGNGGAFTLRVLNARLDGRAVGLGSVLVPGQPPETQADSLVLSPNTGAVPIINDVPVRGSSLQLQIDIDAGISTTASRINDRTVLRGDGSFELVEH
ncbi:hypothetical protein [Herbaspirillum sp. SJZ099]|uniref:hypothetical protein n=1 Tax=Herbaspirillum sp. SJZ099 TaxID=2572916 RepID=UPI0011A656AF|nr:hypothetical protein [Herbaspirillum sp. SJZ099]TWC71426.1 hypothetical protein FB597_101399 [Herbaspirillum sp. SJZ099]